MKIQRSFIVGCVLAIFLMLCPMPELNRFLRYGMDLLHAPFFALLAFFLDQKRRKHPQGMSAPVLWTLLLLSRPPTGKCTDVVWSGQQLA